MYASSTKYIPNVRRLDFYTAIKIKCEYNNRFINRYITFRHSVLKGSSKLIYIYIYIPNVRKLDLYTAMIMKRELKIIF